MTSLYRMLQLLHQAPTDVSNIVFKMKHEMDLSEVKNELLDRITILRRIEFAFQAYARDGRFRVTQYIGGMAGQSIIYSHEIDNYDLGYFWHTYDMEHRRIIEDWSNDANVDAWTDDEITAHYGCWKEDLGNGLVRIRLMIDEIPPLPEFEEFHEFDYQRLFWYHFPGFFPIEVIVPASCVHCIVIPLTQSQLAVKHHFEEDIIYARAKVNAMANLKTGPELNVIIASLLEFFIIKPSMLIHSPNLRAVIYEKIDEFMSLAEICDDKEYADYLYDLIYRISNVLSMIVHDPLYIET